MNEIEKMRIDVLKSVTWKELDDGVLALDIDSTTDHIRSKGYRKQEWISVDERLPRESEVVLAYSEKFGVLHRIYTTYKGETRWWSDEFWSTTEQLGITHWMPLPEAPKMKGGAE
jgi:hypothetical protein